MDFGEVPDVLGKSVDHMVNGLGNLSSAYFATNRLLFLFAPYCFRISTNIGSPERVHSAFERRQLALRVAGRQQHVGGIIVEACARPAIGASSAAALQQAMRTEQ